MLSENANLGPLTGVGNLHNGNSENDRDVVISGKTAVQGAVRKLVLLLGVPIDRLDIPQTIDRLEEFIQIGRLSGKTHHVATVNADFVVNAINDPEARLLLQEADMATADGMPLVWGARKLGANLNGRVTGSDIVLGLVERAARRGYSVYFLGAAPGISAEAADILKQCYPDLIVAGTQSPPYSSVLDMDPTVLDDIRASKPDILFVAFGNPKQEKWIGMYRYQLGVPLMIGIGATLDYISGNIGRAPIWMQRTGLEWFYRLIQEPSRLWRRYTADIIIFSTFFARQWFLMRRARGSRVRIPESDVSLIANTAIVTIHGHVTQDNLGVLRNPANRSMSATPFLLINCQDIEFLDSAAIGTLVGLAKEARDAGGNLYLAAVSPPIRKMLRLLHLEPFFLIFADVDAALAASIREQGRSNVDLTVSYGCDQSPAAISWCVVQAPGRLDAVTSAELENDWVARIEDKPRMVVDFSDCMFLTSAGLALLNRLNQLAKARNGEIRVCGCSQDVQRVIALAQIGSFVAIYPDLAAALKS